MRAEINVPDELGAAALDAALEGLVEASMADLEQNAVGGDWPALYDSGVVYRREPVGSERWLTPSRVRALGYGDCEDLAAWRAAECRVTGEDEDARARVLRSGPRTWHAVVERGDGRIEDPSRVLGMGAAELGSMHDWDASLRREGNQWVATLSRAGAGVMGRAPYAHDALSRACELGAGGLIPGLDIASAALQAALATALPQVPAIPGGAVPPLPAGDAGTLPESARRIASQIQRIATTEARRKLAAAQRQVVGGKRR